MSLNRHVFLPEARAELEDQVEYYRRYNPTAAERFVGLIERLLSDALRFPKAAPAGPAQTRMLHLPGFPVTIVYLIDAPELVVIAIAHQKRTPTYWTDRVGT